MAFCAYCGTQLAEVSYAPCPNCGNPSNGAPRGTVAPAGAPGAPAKSGSNTAVIVIGVVVGLFVIIGVIGIIAAIAIPNLLTATERSKQKRTMADMRSVATAVEAYATDHNSYPKAATLDELRPVLTPTYIKSLPSQDGWMHALTYGAWGASQEQLDHYVVGSAGKDGRWQYENVTEYTQGATTSFDCDIVFVNGNFVQYPEGVQSR